MTIFGDFGLVEDGGLARLFIDSGSFYVQRSDKEIPLDDLTAVGESFIVEAKRFETSKIEDFLGASNVRPNAYILKESCLSGSSIRLLEVQLYSVPERYLIPVKTVGVSDRQLRLYFKDCRNASDVDIDD